MESCTFCKATTERTAEGNLPVGWGPAKLLAGNIVTEVTFCPKHIKEAEKKLDLAFGK